jgi:hypothetical protein
MKQHDMLKVWPVGDTNNDVVNLIALARYPEKTSDFIAAQVSVPQVRTMLGSHDMFGGGARGMRSFGYVVNATGEIDTENGAFWPSGVVKQEIGQEAASTLQTDMLLQAAKLARTRVSDAYVKLRSRHRAEFLRQSPAITGKVNRPVAVRLPTERSVENQLEFTPSDKLLKFIENGEKAFLLRAGVTIGSKSSMLPSYMAEKYKRQRLFCDAFIDICVGLAKQQIDGQIPLFPIVVDRKFHLEYQVALQDQFPVIPHEMKDFLDQLASELILVLNSGGGLEGEWGKFELGVGNELTIRLTDSQLDIANESWIVAQEVE